MQDQSPSPALQSAPASPAPSEPVDSAELLRGRSVLEIDHAGQRYVLRLTRENKLLLTK